MCTACLRSMPKSQIHIYMHITHRAHHIHVCFEHNTTNAISNGYAHANTRTVLCDHDARCMRVCKCKRLRSAMYPSETIR